MANTQVGALSVKITADTKGVNRGIKNTKRALNDSNTAITKNSKEWDQWSARAVAATAAVTASIGIASAKIIDYADAATQINNKLKLATDSTQELAHVTDQLFNASNRTGSSVEASVTLYTKLERATRASGVSTARLLALTDTINKSFTISGATANEAKNAITQLAQGLSAGALRGDEFNSVAEQAPIILEAVGKATGKTAGELRAFAAEGKITTELLIKSLEGYATAINKDFATANKTYSQNLETARNNAIRFVKENDKITGSVDAFGKSLVSLSNNLNLIGDALTAVAVVYAGKYAASMTIATAAKLKSLQATKALIIADNKQAQSALVAAKSKLNSAQQEQAAAKRSMANSRGLAVTSELRTKAVNNLAIANGRLVSAENAVAAATAKTTATQAAATAATTRLGIATRGLGAAMGFLGGPVGAIITAGLALATFVDWEDETEDQAKKTTKEIKEQTSAVNNLTTAYKQVPLTDLQQKLVNTSLKITSTNKELEAQQAYLKGAKIAQQAFAKSDDPKMIEQYKRVSDEIKIAESKIVGLKAQIGTLQDKQINISTEITTGESDEDKNNKLVAQKEIDSQLIAQMQDRFKTAAELEKQRFTEEYQATKDALTRKNELVNGDHALLQEMEAAHQEKLKQINGQDGSFIEQLQTRFATEAELEQAKFASEIKRLKAHLATKREITAEDQSLIKQLKQDHADNLLAIDERQKSESEQLAQHKRNIEIYNAESAAKSVLGILGAFGKKSFKMQKALAIGEGIVNIAAGVAKALNNPYPANLAFAAQVATQGAGLISTIKSAKPGGGSTPKVSGGSAASGGSVGASAPQQQQQATPRSISINMMGEGLLNTDQVRNLIGQINDQVGDGVELNFSGA